MKEVWCLCNGAGYVPMLEDDLSKGYMICCLCNGRGTTTTEKETA
jgi:hypothetical protein